MQLTSMQQIVVIAIAIAIASKLAENREARIVVDSSHSF
jgi:hypothetical protein